MVRAGWALFNEYTTDKHHLDPSKDSVLKRVQKLFGE